MKISRREALTSIAAAATATVALGAGASPAQAAPFQEAKPGPVGKHEVLPLPFDPTKLNGISQKMIVSHHDNNYAGAVKNLIKVEADLAQTSKDTPPYALSGLKERELAFRNSATFHETYFANLGGDGRVSGPIQAALAEAFGSFAKFEETFRAVGLSLAGGSGWTVLAHDLRRDALYISWAGNHTQFAAVGVPLLVMDMYEHAYHIDFGSAAAKYVDAFFGNVLWDEVGRRHERSKKAAAALRG